MTRLALLCALLVGLSAACADDHDPCPAGSMKAPGADRCQAISREPASRSERDASVDGSDASVDAHVEPPADDDASVDASLDMPIEPACDEADAARWRSYHVSGRLVEDIYGCFKADPRCLTGSCPLDECLRARAGVAGCETCVNREARCVSKHCVEACSGSSSDAACLRCACDAGCVSAFDGCGPAPDRDVCSDVPDVETGPSCSDDDVARWQAFHLAPEFATTVQDCVADDARCVLTGCPLDVCLRDAAHVGACDECTAREVRCLAEHCFDDCIARGTSGECRACLCASGCVDELEECAETTLDVCSDCDAWTCHSMSTLSPALIMTIVHPLLSR